MQLSIATIQMESGLSTYKILSREPIKTCSRRKD